MAQSKIASERCKKYEIIVYSAYWLNFNFANCASLSYAPSLKSSDAFVIAEG